MTPIEHLCDKIISFHSFIEPFNWQSEEFVGTERVCCKIGQCALARVLGDLWRFALEREQHGQQFAVCMFNFGQYFDILSTSAANELKKWPWKRKIFQLRSYFWRFFQEMVMFFLALHPTTRLNIQTVVLLSV